MFLLAVLTFQFHNLNIMTATATMVVWVTLRGLVMAFANMPAQTAALADVPTELVGRASAITNIIRSVAGSFGLAVLTSILTMRQAFHGARLAWTLVPGLTMVDSAVSRMTHMFGGGGGDTDRARVSQRYGHAGFIHKRDRRCLRRGGGVYGGRPDPRPVPETQHDGSRQAADGRIAQRGE